MPCIAPSLIRGPVMTQHPARPLPTKPRLAGHGKTSLLQVELNEFDPAFVRKHAERLDLHNLITVLQFQHSETTTDDDTEHQGLDPWVQWVNIHTGNPSATHGVKRLGETRRQVASEVQIWEALASQGNRWVAWGVMNAPGGNREGCEAFMPDPWSFEEDAFPPRLNDLLALPRYMARNYTESRKSEIARNFMRFVRSYASPAHWPVILKFSRSAAGSFAKYGVSLHTLTTLLDYLGALEFVRVRNREQPEFSVIFLNHIAHLQHQFWLPGEDLHPEMELGLRVADMIMGMLLESRREGEAMVVLNGLRQKNVSGQGVHVYRQINPERAMATLIGDPKAAGSYTVEQLMTNDAHLRFTSSDDADRAERLLSHSALEDKEPIFYVERLSPTDVFCQVATERGVAKDALWSNAFAQGKFFDVFETVCERTGAHLQEGDVFADGIPMPDQMKNHEIYEHTLRFFKKSTRAKAA